MALHIRTPYLLLGLILLGTACESPQEDPLFLLKNPEETGLRFENRLQSTEEENILDYLYFYNGGGVAAGDLDNDGRVDLYFTGNQVPNKLFRNKGNFKFEDLTDSAGVSGDGGWSTGVTMADVNGDGLLDIYVCQVGKLGKAAGSNKLYINQGQFNFKESAAAYGLAYSGYSTHSVFFDYDRDGDLDLYLLNHNVKSPEVFAKAENRNIPDASGDKLYKNLLAEGKMGFEDVTVTSGIYSSILGFGLGVAVEDFNEDGWLDLYVSNDFTENDYLYLNQQDGTFKESLAEMISSTSRYSMGNDAADLNGDGLPEIFTTDMLPENPEIWMKSVGEDKAEIYQIKKQYNYQDQYVRNHLQVNLGNGKFAEVALFSGVHASDWSWSPLLFDMDNDGLKDIHVSNGIVKRPNDLDFIQYSQEADASQPLEELRKKQIELLPSLKIANFAWKQVGNLRFENQASSLGLGQETYSNGSTYADLDNDGDLDLVLNNLDQESYVYENRSERLGHTFASIALKQEGFNRQALGGRVQVFAGGKQWSQRVSTSRGFQSGPEAKLILGLGKVSAIDSVRVTWPNGDREIFLDMSLGKATVLEKGKGKATAPLRPEIQAKEMIPPQLVWSHQEKDEVDELKREYLAPKSFTRMGPAVAVGDVNADGLDDLYLGGAMDQAGSLYVQNSQGNFDQVDNPMFDLLAKAEDVAAAFADFNGDGFVDLFVGSAGNEYESGNLYNFDRIFFGNGKGEFQFSMNSLPPIGENTSCVAVHDIDQDGDLDLFVGSAVRSGDYGANPKSSLLINQGNGIFKDETYAWLGANFQGGMVNTAIWADLDGDGTSSLLLSGDWQGIRVFDLKGKSLVETIPSGLEFSSGWINVLQVTDLNGDGLQDILVGNLGGNSKLKASKEKPIWLYHYDFDGNGQADPLIFHYLGEKLVPFGTRDDLIRQIPSLKKKHTSYAEYAKIGSPEDLFSKELLDQSRKLPAFEFRSGVYFQESKGKFSFVPFPDQAQWAPIFDISLGKTPGQVWLGGNFSGFRADLGKSLNLPPLSYLWKNGAWIPVPVQASVQGPLELRSLRPLRIAQQDWILGIRNGSTPVWIR